MGRADEQVTRLQQQLARKDKEFSQKKQRYEKVISELQSDNARLRKIIAEGEMSVDGRSEPEEKEPKREQGTESEAKNNETLRTQLRSMARAYEAQVQEITAYFAAIKERHGEFLLKQGPLTDPRRTVAAVDGMVAQWDSERTRFQSTITSLIAHIKKQNQAEEKLSEEARRKDIEMEIVQEQLRLMKQSGKSQLRQSVRSNLKSSK